MKTKVFITPIFFLLCISIIGCSGCSNDQDPMNIIRLGHDAESIFGDELISASDTNNWVDGTDTATVAITGDAGSRTFTLTTTATLRDNFPGNPLSFSEQSTMPYIITQNNLFDALYCLALNEIEENSKDTITVDYFNNPSITCPAGGCFSTSKLDSSISTRDIAYAGDLSLAGIDPPRLKNSLEFKLSELRVGGNKQIIQDMGTGGSYPVSTDRVAWAMAAWQLLKYLDGTERSSFRDTAYEAITNTLEHDRFVAYSGEYGLYHGEQSYFDWREQTYPNWVIDDPVKIQMNFSLSTNIIHMRALEIAGYLADEKGQTIERDKYLLWASDLKTAIKNTFDLTDHTLYSMMTNSMGDQAGLYRFDIFSSALAVLYDIDTDSALSDIVSDYPLSPYGAPVIWPQKKDVPIYFNRATWPFLNAYWAKAAQKVRNDAVTNIIVESLVRGAAINLSNMQNFEFLSGDPYVDDGANSGPVINSHRQLLSAAGYLAMVHDVIFGLSVNQTGIKFNPYVTRYLRHTLFKNAETLELNNFSYKSKFITVVISLPEKTTDNEGAYEIGEIKLNGATIADTYIPAGSLESNNVITITLEDIAETGKTANLISDTSSEAIYSPADPEITGIILNGSNNMEITISPNGEPAGSIKYNVYRDGALLAGDLSGNTTTYTDMINDSNPPGYCYSVESYYAGSNNHSFRSSPECYYGYGFIRVTAYGSSKFSAPSHSIVYQYGASYYDDWGDPGDTLISDIFSPSYTGDYLIGVLYGNGAGPVYSGITCSVKRVDIINVTDGNIITGSGALVMPHLVDWNKWENSNFIKVALDKTKIYRIEIYHDSSALNMSEFEFYSDYVNIGGSSGAYTQVNISEILTISLSGD